MKNIYLDYNATSPMRPEVVRAMEPFFTDEFANPSSFHRMGQRSRHALEEARSRLISFLGKEDGEIIFTASATEANNLAIRGVARNHAVTSAIEHLSVLKPLEFLSRNGLALDAVRPDEEGVVSVQDVEKSLRPETGLVSLMAANNETGVLQPVHELARALRSKGVHFHVDAVQVLGRMKFDFATLEADSISISAHKIGGPKGVGALWIREGLKIEPLLFGGHHEKNLRAGTENLPAIVGFAKAVEEAFRELEREEVRIRGLRDLLEREILRAIPDVFVNGHRTGRLANTLNLSVIGVDTESLLITLDAHGISASSGSACTSGSLDPSHVLQAMNLPKSRVRSSVRFSLGYGTLPEEIDFLIAKLPVWIEKLRG